MPSLWLRTLLPQVSGSEYDQTRFVMDWHVLPGVTEEWRNDSFPVNVSAGDETSDTGAAVQQPSSGATVDDWGSAAPAPPPPPPPQEQAQEQLSQRQAQSNFAGVMSDGRFGASAFHYRPGPCSANGGSSCYSSTSAKKGYFFSDGEVIAIGNSVHRVAAGQRRQIVTTVENALWETNVSFQVDSNSTVLTLPRHAADERAEDEDSWSASWNSIEIENEVLYRSLVIEPGKTGWFHQNSIGYVIFGGEHGANVQVLCGGEPGGEDTAHGPVRTFLLVISHGAYPTDGTYTYTVVPNMLAEDMEGYVARRVHDADTKFTVVRNDAAAQAVHDAHHQLTQLVFFTAGEVRFYCLSLTFSLPFLDLSLTLPLPFHSFSLLFTAFP